jgi:glycerol-3-phosphate O-acyltransferase
MAITQAEKVRLLFLRDLLEGRANQLKATAALDGQKLQAHLVKLLDEHVTKLQRTGQLPIVSSILRVFMQPYNDLLTKLQAEGRVTDAELRQLREEIEKRGASLSGLVAEHLAQSHDEEPSSPHSDQE